MQYSNKSRYTHVQNIGYAHAQITRTLTHAHYMMHWSVIIDHSIVYIYLYLYLDCVTFT